MTDTVILGAGTRHAEVIQGLENLAEFLYAHRDDLPLAATGNPCEVWVYTGSDEENRAEIDRIAAILGVTAGDPHGTGTTRRAVRNFGGGVTYSATAQTHASVDEHSAVMSYFGAVRPERLVAA